MTPELAYFLKINIGIALFYAFYRLFFYRDTFFNWRRYTLLAFFTISLLYPLMNIQDWVKEQEPMNQIAVTYAANLMPSENASPSVEQATSINHKSSAVELSTENVLLFIYHVGVGALLMRFLIQLISIVFIANRCKKTKIDGIIVRIPEKQTAPFSFFRLIFISPELHTEKEVKEILTHEDTHARQWHSIDIVLSELINIFCWINPFAWLLKRELRNNLEYMADNRVILSGHDTKSYQYHLLGLANQKAAANLYNSFNVLPLKNRITMMNRKRTKSIGRTKYIMFVPLAALLMLFSNIEAVARISEKLGNNLTPNLQKNNNEEEKLFPNESVTTTVVLVNDTIKPKAETGKIYYEVDEMPQFRGGEAALQRTIIKKLNYPKEAKENKEEGKILIKMTITDQGKVSDVSILRGVSPTLDSEVMRVVESLTDWKPGQLKGNNVSVICAIQVLFKIINPQADILKEGKLKKSETEIADYENNKIITSDRSDYIVVDPVKGTKFKIVVKGPGKFVAPYITKEKSQTSDEKAKKSIYTTVEKMPQFPGGTKALLKYIKENMKYPKEAKEKGIQGRVYVSFIVTEKGEVIYPKIMRGLDEYCDAEALRVVKGLPKWIPGKHNGKNVSVQYVLPINFKMK